MKKLFYNEYGYKKNWVGTAQEILFICGISLLLLLTVLVVIISIAKPISELSCNQVAEKYSVEGDYKLLSDTCWLTNKNGTVISEDAFRSFEEVNGFNNKDTSQKGGDR